MESKKEKKKYCPRGTRKNKKGDCVPIKKSEILKNIENVIENTINLSNLENIKPNTKRKQKIPKTIVIQDSINLDKKITLKKYKCFLISV